MYRALKQQVYDKCNGRCAYCGIQISIQNMSIDHIEGQVWFVDSKTDINHTLDNLLPACKSCNSYKNSYTVEQFRGYIERIYEDLGKQHKFKIAERLGVFERKKQVVKFYFETI